MAINNVVSKIDLSTQLEMTGNTLDVRLDAAGSLASSSNGLGIYINPDVPGGLVSTESDGLAFDPSYLQYLSVDATYEDIQGMFAAPFELLAAKTGYLYIIDTVAVAMNAADFSVAFAGGGDLYCQYSATGAASNVTCSQIIAASQLINMVDNTIITIGGGFPENTSSSTSTFWSPNIGAPVCITNDTGAFTGGDGGIFTFHIWYRAINFVA